MDTPPYISSDKFWIVVMETIHIVELSEEKHKSGQRDPEYKPPRRLFLGAHEGALTA
jgi:hypothetical protein